MKPQLGSFGRGVLVALQYSFQTATVTGVAAIRNAESVTVCTGFSLA
jgi:hypothetical protein